MGHFEVACKTKMVKEVTTEPNSEMENQGEFFLGSVSKGADSDSMWHVVLPVNGHNVKFKIDTGGHHRYISACVPEPATAPRAGDNRD